jgi:hypothetical protein
MNLNNLLLSLTYLCGTLALAAAQENESPLRRLRGSSKSSQRHSEAPKVALSDWLSAKNEYADLMASTTVKVAKKESAVLPMEYAENGIALLRDSYQLSNQFLPDEPAAEYAVLSIEAVEEEYISQDSVQTNSDETTSDQTNSDQTTSDQTNSDQTNSENGQDEPVASDGLVGCPSPDEVDYKGTNADICSRIRFFCDEGFEYFGGNDCGCGCKRVPV